MDDTIVNYSGLKQLVAAAAGVAPERASEFLHAFFDVISQELAQGEAVKIKGIGTFRCAEDTNGRPTVAFIPDVELADAINSPFAFFEAVELSPSVTADDLAGIGQPQSDATVEESAPESSSMPEVITAEETTPEQPVDEKIDEQSEADGPAITEDDSSAPDEVCDSDNQPVVEPSEPTDTDTPDSDTESVYEPEEHGISGFGWPWILVTLLIGLLIGFGAGYLCHDSLEAHLIAPEITEISAPSPDADTISADTIVTPVPEPIAQEPIATVETFDTISPTRFLTTMARRHYGQMDFWVYIYMENADILGHPNRARPGTVVRIPPISKYVAPDDTAALQKARRLSVEIYDRYK